ncbi:MAG: CcmD family protein [Chloroflexi bacterium]|nr:CcmD family protein [Chloroflexota bacterium]
MESPESSLSFLFAVYTVTWVAFFAYLFVISQRQRGMRKEIEALRRALEEKEKADEIRQQNRG